MNYRSYGGGGLGDDDQFGEHRRASAFQQTRDLPGAGGRKPSLGPGKTLRKPVIRRTIGEQGLACVG